MKKILILFILLFTIRLIAQVDMVKSVDSLYREDQIYIGIAYNLINNKPEGLAQTGLSPAIQLGFIRDMPINKNRNIAFGMGIGYAISVLNYNLIINKNDLGLLTYNIAESDNSFEKNRFTSHLLELPLEFRWRTSTPETYNFWRIYAGLKFSYAFAHLANYEGDLGNIKFSNVEDFDKLQYGATLSAGYNTWNLHLYYGLNPFFSNKATLNGNSVDVGLIKIGLVFYML